MASADRPPIPEFGSRQSGIAYLDRPGVYAIIENAEGRIAVIETGSGCFLPGGGIDEGESDAAALQREILEETGYQVRVAGQAGCAVEYLKALSDGRYYRIQGRFYQVEPGPKVGSGREAAHHLVWVRPADAVTRLTRQSQAWAVKQQYNL